MGHHRPQRQLPCRRWRRRTVCLSGLEDAIHHQAPNAQRLARLQSGGTAVCRWTRPEHIDKQQKEKKATNQSIRGKGFGMHAFVHKKAISWDVTHNVASGATA